jgi:hypothetical protein
VAFKDDGDTTISTFRDNGAQNNSVKFYDCAQGTGLKVDTGNWNDFRSFGCNVKVTRRDNGEVYDTGPLITVGNDASPGSPSWLWPAASSSNVGLQVNQPGVSPSKLWTSALSGSAHVWRQNNGADLITASPTGGAVNFADGVDGARDQEMYLTPGGTLTALTVNLPSDAKSVIGETHTLVSTQAVTTLTVASSSATILNAPSALVANKPVVFRKIASGIWTAVQSQ